MNHDPEPNDADALRTAIHEFAQEIVQREGTPPERIPQLEG